MAITGGIGYYYFEIMLYSMLVVVSPNLGIYSGLCNFIMDHDYIEVLLKCNCTWENGE